MTSKAETRLAVALFGLSSAVAAAVILVLDRGTTFYYDEWDFVQNWGGIRELFEPHNGHWSTIPMLIYRALFATVGLGHYLPYRVISLIFLLVCSALIFIYLARCFRPLIACPLALLILFFGASWQDLLWAFQIGYIGSIDFGLVALLLLENENLSSDVGATVFLILSLMSSGIGLPILLAVAVEMVLRRAYGRWFVVVIPTLTYLAWYLAFGTPQGTLSNLHLLPPYIADAGASVFASLFSLKMFWGYVMLGATGLVALWRSVRDTGNRPRVVALVALAVAFWGALAFARGEVAPPDTSRYLIPGAVFLIIVLAECLRGFRIPLIIAPVVFGILAVSIWTNVGSLRNGGGFLRFESMTIKAELESVQLMKPYVDSKFVPDPIVEPLVEAGPYLDAVRAHGSPAYTVRQILQSPPEVRAEADMELFRILRASKSTKLQATQMNGVEPFIRSVYAARVSQLSKKCILFTPNTDSAQIIFRADAFAINLRSSGTDVDVEARLFASTFSRVDEMVTVRHASSVLLLPDLHIETAWVVRVTSRSTVEICEIDSKLS